VKCLGDLVTALCPRKEKLDDVRCVLCEGNHPANYTYKGCTIYKELLKKKYTPLLPKQYVSNEKPTATVNSTTKHLLRTSPSKPPARGPQ
jgi:hypothetical protein